MSETLHDIKYCKGLNIYHYAKAVRTKQTCMMRKCGLLTLSPTEQNRSCTLVLLALTPLMRYLFLPPITTLKKEITHITPCDYVQHTLLQMFLSPHLSSDSDLIMGFKPQRTLAFVGVVKDYRHCGLGDATLSIFVHQVLEVGGSHLSK